MVELERLRVLRRFLSPQLAEAMFESGDLSLLEPHRREIAVLAWELRGPGHRVRHGRARGGAGRPRVVPRDARPAHRRARRHRRRVHRRVGARVLRRPGRRPRPDRCAPSRWPSPSATPGRELSGQPRPPRLPGHHRASASTSATPRSAASASRAASTTAPSGPVVSRAWQLCALAGDGEVLLGRRAHDAVARHGRRVGARHARPRPPATREAISARAAGSGLPRRHRSGRGPRPRRDGATAGPHRSERPPAPRPPRARPARGAPRRAGRWPSPRRRSGPCSPCSSPTTAAPSRSASWPRTCGRARRPSRPAPPCGSTSPGCAARSSASGIEGILVTRPPGYLLDVPPEAVDIARFEDAGRRRPGRPLADGRPDEAVTAFREALALWRGPALAEVAGVHLRHRRGHPPRAEPAHHPGGVPGRRAGLRPPPGGHAASWRASSTSTSSGSASGSS